MNAADEIREYTARSELHPLVACNFASPRGLCNAALFSDGARFCTLDYGHEQCAHQNGDVYWSMPWPPTGSHH